MSKRARRILVTFAVITFASLIVWVVFYGKSRPNRLGTAPTAQQPDTTAVDSSPSTQSGDGATATQASTMPDDAGVDAPSATSPATTSTSPADPLRGLRAIAPVGEASAGTPQPLGSLDPRRDMMRVGLSKFGAGIERIDFSHHWRTALARRQAESYFDSLNAGDPIDFDQLPRDERYTLVERAPTAFRDAQGNLTGFSGTPIMAVRSILINGAAIDLINPDVWSETARGRFETVIVDDQDRRIAHITRQFQLIAGYDIALQQRVKNLSDAPLQVQWIQYGPVDLPEDTTGNIPRRRLHFGYLPDPAGRPTIVLADDQHVIERSSAVKQYERALENPQNNDAARLWPTADSRATGAELSWFASTNRYFGLAIHPPVHLDQPTAYSLEPALSEVDVGVSNLGDPIAETLYSVMRSPSVSVGPGDERGFDVAIYAGPLDRHTLARGAHDALSMGDMIIYSMGSCCTFLTFQWLAHLLLWFLSFLHNYVFFDWALAIIGLVIVVRTLLHPLTKKAQVNMMRFGKQMQALKPELDKLQKKFGNDKQKMQQEQIRLMREHRINPLQMLGCLPMFLQMPIWIALWAMLYLAFDLRQEPAFYGVFQMIAERWPFLADLSSPDRFIPLGVGFSIPLLGSFQSINLLPLLMGVVFFIQQKYMTPPTTATMTPEQIQQQKIMKWMMVLLFPLMMYNTPSGLTLYILTSSTVGILESRYIRRHIDQMDLTPKPVPAKPSKPRDALARTWAKRLEEMREKQRQAQQQRQSFKKRK